MDSVFPRGRVIAVPSRPAAEYRPPPRPATFADAALEGLLQMRRMPPGWLMQVALRLYLEVEHGWEVALGRLSTKPAAATPEVAERSGELMRLHYDLPLPLFAKMLGPSMKYSMALWENGERTLEDAQEAMLADACRKARVRDGESILDLGCGFGSLSAYLLRTFPNARVTGLTLSRTQADYVRRAQNFPGHPLNNPRFRLVQADFNAVEFSEKFDRVMSLGVFEHISNLDLALHKVRRFVNEGGGLFLHYIVYLPVREGQHTVRQCEFIQRHIFPGGRVYAFDELARHQQDFALRAAWYRPGRNYRKTIECWLQNFLRRRALIAQAAQLSERTLRVWEIYLRACAATFATARGWAFGNGQYYLEARS